MDDPLLVRRFEGFCDLFRDRQRFVDWDRAASDALRQIVAFDQFHDEGGHALAFFEPVDTRDVGMIQRGKGLRFALEAREPIGVVCKGFGQELDCDISVQLRIARAIYLAHAPGPQGGKDFVRPNACAGVEGQTGAIEYRGRAAAPTRLVSPTIGSHSQMAKG